MRSDWNTCRRLRGIVGGVALTTVAIAIPAYASPQAAGDEQGEDAAPTDAASMTISEAREAVVATLSKVETIRGLEFKKPVPVEVVDDAAVREHALERLRKFYGEEQFRAQQTAYILLGLLPEGTDILDEYLQVLAEQAGGYYSPSDKSFFLLDDMPAGMAPILAAHELTHALEDQHFNLDARLEEAFPNEDWGFARSAVHEGSAMLVMSLYMAGAMADGTVTASDLQAMGETEAGRAEKLMAMPTALRRPLMASYLLGMNFLSRGDLSVISSGFPTGDVNRCYREGPQSSEQILHPEKFWDPSRRDDPTSVELRKAGRVLGRGWKRVESGVLGELVLGVMVGVPTPSSLGAMSGALGGKDWTNAASTGWDGDLWELWTRGDSAVVLLMTVWDSAEDAVEFEAALEARPGLAWKVQGSQVALVSGDAGGKTEALLEALLRQPRKGGRASSR